MSARAAMIDTTIRCLARIQPGFRFVRDERRWVVFCRDGAWHTFDSWPGSMAYAVKAMQLAKVPADRRRDIILNHLVPAMKAGPPIAVASRDDLPRNPFIGLRLRRAKAARLGGQP
jgi:hypothetical protein